MANSNLVIENIKVALFIDAENIGHNAVDYIVNNAKTYGKLCIKRIYGDWLEGNVQSWTPAAKDHALRTIHQISYVKGKNTADIALTTEVMSSVFEKNIEIYCLAAVDSDYTRLVQELQERGKTVIGFGRRDAIPSLVNAFDEYLYIEDEDKSKTNGQVKLPDEQLKTLKTIIADHISSDSRALLSQICDEMKKQYADFTSKNYGCKTMPELFGKLIDNLGNYELHLDKDKTTFYLTEIQRTKRNAG